MDSLNDPDTVYTLVDAMSGEDNHVDAVVCCCKCKAEPGLYVLRKQNAYCKDCLEWAIVQKIRCTMRKPGGLCGRERVGLSVSGGVSSMCAWYILEQHVRIPADARRDKKRLPFDMDVVHVTGLGFKEECNADERIAQFHEMEGGSTHAWETVDANVVLYGSDTGDTCIKSLLDVITDETARTDMQHILLKRTLLEKGRMAGWSHVLLGSTADKRAADAVAAAAKGQGNLLSKFSQAVDDGASTPRLVYCMKDVSLEEVIHLTRALTGNGVEDASEKAVHDINDLAIHFTRQLQSSNPGGVSNIMSTIGKLVNVAGDKQTHCPLCTEAMHEDEKPNVELCQKTIAAVMCDSCKSGIFGCFTNDSLVENDHVTDILSKLPPCIRMDIETMVTEVLQGTV